MLEAIRQYGRRRLTESGPAEERRLLRHHRDHFLALAEHLAAHLGLGFGNHACAGRGLARLEPHAVLKALAERVERIELAGEPVRALNNITRGFASLPVTLRCA